MAKPKNLRDQNNEQLESMIHDLRSELFDLRNELAMTHKLDKPHLIKEKKREMARALTILKERKIHGTESK